MNDFKFRAWCISAGKGSFIYFRLEEGGKYDWDIFDEKPIYQQFTCLKDINGKDIYDGDLIKGDTYGPYMVFWERGAWCSCCYSDSEPIRKYKTIEVISNILETPEYEGVQ